MLENIFIEILNMTFISSFVIVAVILLRLLIKKMPKRYSYYLWIAVLIRLTVPFSFKSIYSVIPVNEKPISNSIGYSNIPTINTNIQAIDAKVNASMPVAIEAASVNPMQIIISILVAVWLFGLAFFLLYGVYSYIKLNKRLINSHTEDGKVYTSDKVNTAFVLGLIRPKIFLPLHTKEEELEYIVYHEQIHIKRLDHVIRFVSYLVLAIHWFNPFVWIAFCLSGRDMEMSCDEKVIEKLGSRVKKNYSKSILSYATNKNGVNVSYLAFFEGSTKGRIKNVLSYKKPKTYFTIVALLLIIVASVALLTNKAEDEPITSSVYEVKDILYQSPIYSFSYTVKTAPTFNISSDRNLYYKEKAIDDFKSIGGIYEIDLSKKQLLGLIEFKEVLDDRVISLINKKSKVYKVEAENDVFYLVLVTKSKDVLIFYGYESDEISSVRWIFDVSKKEQLDVSISSIELFKNRTKYVGDNSLVSTIASQLEYPKEIVYNGIELQTDNEPYSLRINLKDNRKELDSSKDDSIRFLYELDACILFSLIENLDKVFFNLDSELYDSEPIVYDRKWANNIIGIDLWKESESKEGFNDLLIVITNRLNNSNEVSISTHIKEAENENLIETYISKAILDYKTKGGVYEGTAFESHITFSIVEKKDEITVYALTLFNTLSANDEGIKTHSGSHVPCEITLSNREENKYELIEYKEPRDGALYGPDIKDIFPDDIEDEVINTQKYITMQIQACYDKAIEFFDINSDDIIDSLLKEIMSSPMVSSNPLDYIKAHEIEYRELKYYGEYLLKYIENSRALNEKGLKGSILDYAYDDLTNSKEK